MNAFGRRNVQAEAGVLERPLGADVVRRDRVAEVAGRRGAARQQRHPAHAAALHRLHQPGVVVAAEQERAVGAVECGAQAGPVVEVARHGAHPGGKRGAVPAHDRPDLMTLGGENLHERPADVAAGSGYGDDHACLLRSE